MMIAIATADSAALTPIEKRVMNMPSLPSELQVNGSEYKLNGNEHGNKISTCYKTKETNEKQQC